MPLKYTSHAQNRLAERGISESDCQIVVDGDRNPWEEKLRTGNHLRCYSDNLKLTVITDKRKEWVITAFKGDGGGWKPQDEDL